MIRDQRTFIRAVMAKTGKNQTDLGEDLGYANAYNVFHSRANARTNLKYGETIQLLAMCGWLTKEAQELLLGQAAAEMNKAHTLLSELEGQPPAAPKPVSSSRESRGRPQKPRRRTR